MASSLLLASSVLAGCSSADGADQNAPEVNDVRRVTVCFSGAYQGGDPYSTVGNPELGALCEKMPNVIRVGQFPFFTFTQNAQTALGAVIAALDTNHNGHVDAADGPTEINVVGYSWGGFNAMSFIKAWNESPKVEVKAIARYFAIDPFRPDALVVSTVSLHVPGNVQQFWEFRHTIAPADDCSQGGTLGPYTGRPPICTAQTTCTDYDYSAATTQTFDGKLGPALGHCDIPGAAADAVLALTSGTALPDLPPTIPVRRQH